MYARDKTARKEKTVFHRDKWSLVWWHKVVDRQGIGLGWCDLRWMDGGNDDAIRAAIVIALFIILSILLLLVLKNYQWFLKTQFLYIKLIWNVLEKMITRCLLKTFNVISLCSECVSLNILFYIYCFLFVIWYSVFDSIW